MQNSGLNVNRLNKESDHFLSRCALPVCRDPFGGAGTLTLQPEGNPNCHGTSSKELILDTHI